MVRTAYPAADEAGAAAAPAPSSAITIRPLRTQEDYLACVDLQKETWGPTFQETVPPSMLRICQRIGGIAAGAFDAEGRMLGFVFGISGIENGRPVHWSDMMAVRPEARDHGVGRQLKEYQRDHLLGLGIEVVYWTFDPLVARNAHLNLNRLGTEVVEYVLDFFGDVASDLFEGLGTDRFVVAWRIGEQRGHSVQGGAVDAAGTAGAPVVNLAPGEESATPLVEPAGERQPRVRVQIPLDIFEVKTASPSEAAEWRVSTRQAFLTYLRSGYRVTGFYRDDAAARGYYLLAMEGV